MTSRSQRLYFSDHKRFGWYRELRDINSNVFHGALLTRLILPYRKVYTDKNHHQMGEFLSNCNCKFAICKAILLFCYDLRHLLSAHSLRSSFTTWRNLLCVKKFQLLCPITTVWNIYQRPLIVCYNSKMCALS